MYFIWNMRCINLQRDNDIHDKYEVHKGIYFIYNIKYIEYGLYINIFMYFIWNMRCINPPEIMRYMTNMRYIRDILI